MKIYLAARHSRFPELQGYAARLESLGHKITSRWIRGEHQALDAELLDPAHRTQAREFLADDMGNPTSADAIVAFTETQRTPTRGGRHVEFGIAIGAGKRLFVVGPLENQFYVKAKDTQFDDFYAWFARLGSAYHRQTIAGS